MTHDKGEDMNRLRVFYVACVVCLIAIIGCKAVDASHRIIVDDKPPARPSDCDLDIYEEESEIEKPFEKICVIESVEGSFAGSYYSGVDAARSLAKKEACECGADALLLDEVKSIPRSGYKPKITMHAYGIVYKNTDSDSSTQDSNSSNQ